MSEIHVTDVVIMAQAKVFFFSYAGLLDFQSHVAQFDPKHST